MVALQNDPGSRRKSARTTRSDRMEAFPAARSRDARAMRRGQPSGVQARRRGASETAWHFHGAKYCARPQRADRRRIRIDPRGKLTPAVCAYCNEPRAQKMKIEYALLADAA